MIKYLLIYIINSELDYDIYTSKDEMEFEINELNTKYKDLFKIERIFNVLKEEEVEEVDIITKYRIK